MRLFRAAEQPMCCSFCHKTQAAVEKLISSPSDYPRAYICDECIAVCYSIIEDDRAENTAAAERSIEFRPDPSDAADSENGAHPLLSHPLAYQFLAAVENWIRQESLGPDAAEELAEMRRLSTRLLRPADDRTTGAAGQHNPP